MKEESITQEKLREETAQDQLTKITTLEENLTQSEETHTATLTELEECKVHLSNAFDQVVTITDKFELQAQAAAQFEQRLHDTQKQLDAQLSAAKANSEKELEQQVVAATTAVSSAAVELTSVTDKEEEEEEEQDMAAATSGGVDDTFETANNEEEGEEKEIVSGSSGSTPVKVELDAGNDEEELDDNWGDDDDW